MPFKISGSDRLKSEDEDKIYYDGKKAYRAERQGAEIILVRDEDLDVRRLKE